MIHNVHLRVVPADPARVGQLLEQIAEPGNPVWPGESWPPLRLDNGLAVGSSGGHGPIRYHVVEHRPGRRVEFRLDPTIGIAGTHAFDVLDGPRPGTSTVRHTIRAVPTTWRGRLLWMVAIRAFHDAVLEDMLDRFATAADHPPARPARWSPWVRLLRRVVRRGRVRPTGPDHAPTGRAPEKAAVP